MRRILSETLTSSIRAILAHLENGDPIEAINKLSVLLEQSNIVIDTRKLLEKAYTEASAGDPSKAEIYLGLLL